MKENFQLTKSIKTMKKLVMFFVATMLLGSCSDEVMYNTSVESLHGR